MGVVVGVVIAEDSDPNSDLSYSLTSPDTVFTINSTTGVITTAKSIDRETLSNPFTCTQGTPTNTTCYTINVIVQDITSGEFGFRSATLFVQDLDDTPPVFIQDSYTISISENTAVGSELDLKIDAEDSDRAIILSYYIEDNLDFEIHLRSAIVSIKRKLDYETNKTYSLIPHSRRHGR